MEPYSDDLVASFVSITGVNDTAQAAALLEASGWDVQLATELYFNSPVKPKNTKSDVRKQKNSEFLDDDYVRAPIPSTTGVLSEDPRGDSFFYQGAKGRPRRGFKKDTPKNVFETFSKAEDLRDFRRETQRLESEIKGNKQDKEKVQRLADLFSPPVNLLFTEGWDLAKLFALDSKKWLLVNIQETSEFASQMLNRDTWKNSKVQDLIRNAFVFWQRYRDNPDGKMFTEFYPTSEFPQIAVIDPRTGERVKQWTGFIDPNVLYDELFEFLQKHSLEDYSAASVEVTPKKEQRVESIIDCSEEEQLKLALEASLHEHNKKKRKDTESSESTPSSTITSADSSSDSIVQSKKSKLSQTASTTSAAIKVSSNNTTAAEPLTKTTQQNSVSSSSKESQTQTSLSQATQQTEELVLKEGETECIIQIRESNGNVLKRSFSSGSTVQHVYDYVARNRTDGKEDEFVLMTPFPRKSFSGESKNMTLQEAQLTPRAVLIVSLSN